MAQIQPEQQLATPQQSSGATYAELQTAIAADINVQLDVHQHMRRGARGES
jgi:hypothetical protein